MLWIHFVICLFQNNQQIPGMAELQARQEKILQQLAELKDQMMSIKSDLKITAVPANTCLRAPPEKVNSYCL